MYYIIQISSQTVGLNKHEQAVQGCLLPTLRRSLRLDLQLGLTVNASVLNVRGDANEWQKRIACCAIGVLEAARRRYQ